MPHDFTTLEAWKLSHKLMIDVYEFIKTLPPEEKYIRIDQIKRSVSSIPANIAEGNGRYYYLENISFCRNARGSLDETKNHLLACHDLHQGNSVQCKQLLDDFDTIRKILNGYIRYLKGMKVGKEEE